MRRWCIGLLIVVVGCRGKPEPTEDPRPATGVEVRPVEAAGLHNVFRVSDTLYSGSGPEGDAAFASLQKLGIKTILSVDGATPDVAAAARHGMKYVHLPFGYDGIPADKLAGLAASQQLDGPVYVHCHHGKHRGPTAVAVIQRCRGWDADRATAWQKTAGTDPKYSGLYAVARDTPPTAGKFDFQPVAAVPDLARRMVEIDARWDHLKLVKAAGSKPPPDHPDIDPPHEALQLVEHYRESNRLDAVKRRGPAFVSLMADAEAAATELETGLRAKDEKKAAAAFTRSAELCAKCHGQFRDKPGGKE